MKEEVITKLVEVVIPIVAPIAATIGAKLYAWWRNWVKSELIAHGWYDEWQAIAEKIKEAGINKEEMAKWLVDNKDMIETIITNSTPLTKSEVSKNILELASKGKTTVKGMVDIKFNGDGTVEIEPNKSAIVNRILHKLNKTIKKRS